LDPKYIEIAVVIISTPEDKKYIKKVLDQMGVPSQFVVARNLERASLSVYGNILK
jgi:hypothetical protein